MVKRTESKGFDEFVGKVVNVILEEPTEKRETPAYHIEIEVLDKEIKGKTGLMHDWIGVPKTSKKDSVPQGSVIDAYIRALERLESTLKTKENVEEIFVWMKGKKFRFNKEKLGKSFGKHDAMDYWVPVALA